MNEENKYDLVKDKIKKTIIYEVMKIRTKFI